MTINTKTQQDNLIKLIDEVQDCAILLLDDQGNVQTWNAGAERIKGYRAEEITGKNFRIFYTEEDRINERPEYLIETAKKHGVAHDDGWRMRKDGTRFWGSITINCIRDESGNVIGFGKITRDLTNQKEVEKNRLKYMLELTGKNQHLAELASANSQDWQYNIDALNNTAKLIQLEYKGKLDIKFDTYINSILKSSHFLKGIMEIFLKNSTA